MHVHPYTRMITIVDAPAGDGVGAGMTVEQLRTVVASLRAAVAFSRALCGSMASLTQLLASSTLSDVQVQRKGTHPVLALQCTQLFTVQCTVRLALWPPACQTDCF